DKVHLDYDACPFALEKILDLACVEQSFLAFCMRDPGILQPLQLFGLDQKIISRGFVCFKVFSTF
ncbi:hypothetical protein, partial [Acinetobacter baumannii]|uniref:hypothetical protein n=1 Tax=Acinetobacter baumannii TaxID=470 RepID=UPI0033926ECF